MALVLYGPSRMGKTAWARSLGRHNYWKGALNINTIDNEAEYHVFDDLRKFRDFDYKSWMGADDFTVSGKYLKEQTVTGGVASGKDDQEKKEEEEDKERKRYSSIFISAV